MFGLHSWDLLLSILICCSSQGSADEDEFGDLSAKELDLHQS